MNKSLTLQKKTQNFAVKLDLTLRNSNATHKKTIDNRIIKEWAEHSVYKTLKVAVQNMNSKLGLKGN